MWLALGQWKERKNALIDKNVYFMFFLFEWEAWWIPRFSFVEVLTAFNDVPDCVVFWGKAFYSNDASLRQGVFLACFSSGELQRLTD